MQNRRPFWYLLNVYGWVVLAMSIVTAMLIGQAWVVLLGVIGYLLAVLVDLLGGRSLSRTGAVRLAIAEQENRELRAEQARLLGAINELKADQAGSPPPDPAPASDATPPQSSEPAAGPSPGAE